MHQLWIISKGATWLYCFTTCHLFLVIWLYKTGLIIEKWAKLSLLKRTWKQINLWNVFNIKTDKILILIKSRTITEIKNNSIFKVVNKKI